ncbi:MAG: CBS domain-containing protein [Planctomycetales bacterium]|nr:CBS domain-containing protein [Planctomycetales bacterium]
MCQLTARDFMVKKLITLRPEMDVLDAVKMLLKNRISGAPVVSDSGEYLGVFSEKCAMHVILDAAYDQLPTNEVRAFMDVEAQTIGPDAHLLSVAQVFLLTSFRRLPVLEDGRLVGQVSRRDVLRAAMSDVLKGDVRVTESSLLYLSAIRDRDQAPVA